MQEPVVEKANVVSLFNVRQKNEEKAAQDSSVAAASENTEPGSAASATPSKESFDDAMRRNAENAERIRRERLKQNQSVLRSYKIKN